MVFHGAGDGFVYGFDAVPLAGRAGKPGVLKEVWRFDCNPHERKFRNGRKLRYGIRGRRQSGMRADDVRGGDGPSEVIATPVFYRNRVYASVGQDTRHGMGKGCLSSMDATGSGDVTKTGVLWRYPDLDRSFSTVSIADGLLYVADYTGIVHCLDADTGRLIWKHDTGQRVWGSTLVADGKVYLGTERGRLWIFAAGREKKVINIIDLHAPVCTTPVVANGVLYVASHKYLYAVQAPQKKGKTHEPNR